jgi:hypothetical protein
MSSPVVISALSTVYIKSRITATVNGATYNPTGDVVAVAFKAPGVSPAAPDWQTGSWEAAGTSYFARLLVGPAALFQLAVGTYHMWIRITDSPEILVLQAPGTVRIY